MNHFNRIHSFLCACLLSTVTVCGFDFDDFLIAPLRIHLLLAATNSPLRTTLTAGDITRIIPKINRVWAQAGIHFYVESIVTEEAGPGEVPDHPGKGSFLWLLSHIPPATRDTNMFNVYLVKEFAVNGVYFPKAIFVKDTAALRPVSGGIDEPIPRVIAHELGHALGLLHRQKLFNLMASGTTGTELNEEEIKNARFAAKKLSWVRSASDVVKLAEKLQGEGKKSEADTISRRLDGLVIRAEIK